MACCSSMRASSIPIAVCSSSTSPALGCLRQFRFSSSRPSSTTGFLRISSRSARLLPCQDGRRNDPASNEEAASAGEKKEKKGMELDLSTLERALGRSFGTALWYTVLIVTLAIFAGGYVFLLVNYADFSDIPILNGLGK